MSKNKRKITVKLPDGTKKEFSINVLPIIDVAFSEFKKMLGKRIFRFDIVSTGVLYAEGHGKSIFSFESSELYPNDLETIMREDNGETILYEFEKERTILVIDMFTNDMREHKRNALGNNVEVTNVLNKVKIGMQAAKAMNDCKIDLLAIRYVYKDPEYRVSSSNNNYDAELFFKNEDEFKKIMITISSRLNEFWRDKIKKQTYLVPIIMKYIEKKAEKELQNSLGGSL